MRQNSARIVVFASLLASCDASDDTEANSSGSTTGNEPGQTSSTTSSSSSGNDEDTLATGTEGGESGDDSTTSGPPTPFVWTPTVGPCVGSGTNALWFDDRQHGYVGCGENASGEGLFTTSDGAVSFEDNVRFGEVRIMDIRRGSDGALYGAGIHQLDGYPVWRFEEGGALIDATGLYTPSSSAFLAVNQAENIAVDAGGRMLIDSLTGTTAAYRATDDFEEVPSLGETAIRDPDAPSFQVRRIVAEGEDFYAVGSLINDPARVHLPSRLDAATYHFETVLLQPETRDGELLDMHVWDSEHIIVAGHDQSERFPLIYLVDGQSPYESSNWQKVELFDSGFDFEGGINDLHVVGNRVVMVGEKFPTSQGGFVLVSEDGGLTYEDVTPEDAGALSRVWLFDDGQMVVAGGGQEMWIFD